MSLSAKTKSKRLTQVLRLVDLGLCVIPLVPRGKEPFTPLLPRESTGKRSWIGYADRRATRDEIKAWVKNYPELNFGVITGQAGGGYVVADCDHGLDTCYKPPTWIVETGRGFHRYYKANHPVGTRQTDFGHLKGEGSYVVVPPSVHPSGVQYRWAGALSPWDVDLASLPRELDSGKHRQSGRFVAGLTDDARKSTSLGMGAVWPNEMCCLGNFAEMAKDIGVVTHVMRRLGTNVERLGAKVLCPLPGHDEKTMDPSAALWAARGGYIRLQCFHDCEWWSIPELYAAHATGEYRHLRRGETAMWWLRALDETGVAPLPHTEHLVLPRTPLYGTQELLDGFVQLWRLRHRARPGLEEMPFSYEFASGWCGLDYSESAMRRRMRWLLDHGYLVMVKGHGPRHQGDTDLTLYRLGCSVEPPISGETIAMPEFLTR